MQATSIDYKNISFIKVADCRDLNAITPRYTFQIIFNNTSSLVGDIKPEHWEQDVFENRKGKIENHWDTDFYYTEGGAENKFEIAEIDRLVGFCLDMEYFPPYNLEL